MDEDLPVLQLPASARARESAASSRTLPPDDGAPRSRWSRVRNKPVLAALFALAVITIPDGDKSLAFKVATGLVATPLWLAVAGTIVYLARRGRRPWVHVTFGIPAMTITAILFLLAYAGGVGQRAEEYAQATPDPNGSEAQRLRANQDYRRFDEQLQPAMAALADFRAEDDKAVSYLEQGKSDEARAAIGLGVGHLQRARDILAVIPNEAEADLNGLRDRVVAALDVLTRGYHQYVVALDGNIESGLLLGEDEAALAALERGDVDVEEGSRLLTAEGPVLDALIAKYAGPARE